MGYLNNIAWQCLFLYSAIVHLPSGHKELVWSIDASVSLFGAKFNMLFVFCYFYY